MRAWERTKVEIQYVLHRKKLYSNMARRIASVMAVMAMVCRFKLHPPRARSSYP
ncbi:MAG: hypothetical protein A4E31_00717 [Methanomassiliicoccales archaeon PtaU1.Bin030]|nr:MAG: hypothetical protein A4E31_00717 [Methanomassiliicoccales archaeon PtaU1.Bin030]